MVIFIRNGFLLLLLVGGYLFLHSESGQWLLSGDPAVIAERMQSFGTIAALFMFLLIMLQAFFPYIPFIVLAGVCVLLFGLHWGFLICWTATTAGAILTFLIARYWIRDWAEKRVMYIPFVRKLNEQIKANGFLSIFLSRLVGVVPSSAINLAAGISQIGKTSFVLGTMVGNIPIVWAESWLGHYVLHFEKTGGKFVILIILLLLAFFILKRRLQKVGQ